MANKLSLGITAATDLDQISGLVDSDNDGFPDYVDFDPSNEDIWSAYQDDINSLERLFDCSYELINCPDTVQTKLTELQNAFNDEQLQNDFLENDNISGLSLGLSYNLSNNMVLYGEFSQLMGNTKNPYSNKPNFDTKLGYGLIPIGITLAPNSLNSFGAAL